jgi:catechol 2,3-dioxygenase-like lactoylglutathione lyase family enzyme
MPLRLVAVAFDTDDPERVAAFWASILGRDAVPETGSVLLPGGETQVGLRFVEAATETPGPNRVHLHLTSATRADHQDTVATARGLGARDIDVGQLPEEGHVVLADPGDNEFCVIEPGNAFLAGCGFLGEVTCEGTREVGLFWRAALGWPLVWDRDQQTAVQSPEGGTKISWDVRPGTPSYGSRRQRFDLAASDLASDVARLVELGASELGDRDDRIVLADPDGGEFSLCRA